MISDDYAMILTPFPNKRLDYIDIHGIKLRKWLVQNVERCIAQQDQIQFGQPCLANSRSSRVVYVFAERPESVSGFTDTQTNLRLNVRALRKTYTKVSAILGEDHIIHYLCIEAKHMVSSISC